MDHDSIDNSINKLLDEPQEVNHKQSIFKNENDPNLLNSTSQAKKDNGRSPRIDTSKISKINVDKTINQLSSDSEADEVTKHRKMVKNQLKKEFNVGRQSKTSEKNHTAKKEHVNDELRGALMEAVSDYTSGSSPGPSEQIFDLPLSKLDKIQTETRLKFLWKRAY